MSQPHSVLKIVLLLASLITSSMSSARPRYEVVRLPVSNLLPQSSVERLHFDAKKYLWIRTQAGYHRFDGNQLRNLYTFTGSGLRGHRSPSLTKHLILTQDGESWLFDATKGLFKYNIFSRNFEQIENASNALFKGGRTATSAIYDSQQMLWLGMSDGSIVELDGFENDCSTKPNIEMHLSQGDFISAMIELSNGKKVLLSYFGTMLTCSQTGTDCVQDYLPEKIGLNEPLKPLWILAGAGELLYISTYSGGIFAYSNENKTLIKLPLVTDEGIEHEVGSNPPIALSDDGDLWVATINGVFIYSVHNENSSIKLEGSLLENTVVNTILNIGNGELLLGTISGIYLARRAQFENFGDTSGLRSTLMTGFAAYSDSEIFLATFRGLDVLDMKSGKIVQANKLLPDINLIDPRIMSIYQHEQSTWMGYFRNGLYRYDNHTHQVRRINDPSAPIEAVSEISKIDQSTLGIATQNSGVHLVDARSGKLRKIPSPSTAGGEAIGNTAFTVKPIQNGNLIAGTAGGLLLIKLAQSRDSISVKQTELYLKGKDVYCIVETSRGEIWVGTHEQGLFYWDAAAFPEFPSFSSAETSPALPSKTIYAIEEDKLGMLWVSTNNGLVRLNPITKKITIYDKTDGLLDNEFNQGASFIDSQERIYFGGYKGFVRLDPSSFVGVSTPPAINLVDLYVSRQSVSYDPGYTHGIALTLDHNDYAVDFEFSTMDVIAPGRSQYKYKLEGFDRDWVDNGNKSTATFTNLPAGDYMFRVIGANSDGVWNYDGISIPVKVLPAPWRTWWAISFYVIAALALLTLMKRYYDARLLNREAIRQKQLMTNTAMRAMDELQDQLDQEHRLVRNLRKHAAQTFDIIEQSLEIEGDELSDAKAKKSIQRSKQRLVCLRALESSVYFHGDTLKVNLRDAVDNMFTKIIDSSPKQECEIILANQISEKLIPIDVATPIIVLLHELMLNSVNHAFTDLAGIECLEVALQEKSGPKRWIVDYSDSGVGLSADVDPGKPTTRGMRLIGRTVDKLNGNLKVDRSRGTAFTITIPQPADT